MGYVTPADVPISDNWYDHLARSSAEPGTDYATAYGTDLRAPEAGQVIGVDRDPGGPAGRRLTMLLDDGRMVDWIHLSEIWVEVGARFERGQTGLALSGASRYGENWPDDMGPHVHVTLRADRWRPFSDTLNFEDYVGGGSGWSDQQKQDFLDSLGYDTGAPGWGPKCEAATYDFQGKVGLHQDSNFGPDTTGAAEVIEAGRNATDRPTREIQTALAAAGFDPGPIDDHWGNKTSLAEYRWQQAANLIADAIHGPASDARMFPVVATGEGRNATLDDRSLIPPRSTKDIQARLGVPQTGVWDKPTSDALAAFQRAEEIDEDRIWGITCDGLAFPPANFGRLVDFSFARVPLDKLNRHQIIGLGRYLWKPKYDDGRTNKGLSREEAQGYAGSGKTIVQIYEEDGKELLGGYQAGVEAAKAAEAYRISAGLPACAVYFNVDFDIAPGDIPTVLAALDGAASVIGLARVGLYAGYFVIKAAFDAGKITWGFQTYGWSLDGNGRIQWDPRTHLRQWSNGQWGDTVDFIWAMAPEYGQHPVGEPDPGPEPEPEPPVDLSGIMKLLQQILDFLKGLFGGGK